MGSSTINVFLKAVEFLLAIDRVSECYSLPESCFKSTVSNPLEVASRRSAAWFDFCLKSSCILPSNCQNKIMVV